MNPAVIPPRYDPARDCDSWTVDSSHRITYQIEICPNVLDLENDRLATWCSSGNNRVDQVLVVVDREVDRLYGSLIRNYFTRWDFAPTVLVMSGDEASKGLSAAEEVAEKMGEVGLLRRSEKVVVFGGGVVMDIVGMAANLFRRGVPYIRVPTTLLGQVDAGVGVKTGVNHGDHKNRLGTYYAPLCALIDPTFLSTVSERHIINGLAEIVKIALVKDRDLFELIEAEHKLLSSEGFASNTPTHAEIIRRAVVGMLEELEPNLHEAQLERIVDFGHTFSPSLELIADPPLLHGEAVAIDMALCVAISTNRDLIDRATALRIVRLLLLMGLPVSNSMFTPDLLRNALVDTIAHRDGQQRLPLITAIGDASFVNDVSPTELHNAVALVEELEIELSTVSGFLLPDAGLVRA
jgi:3-dehydroquinate synthase